MTSKKIVALFLCVSVLLSLFSVTSYATDYQSKYNFWNWLYDNGWYVGKAIASTADSVCSVSTDGLHHSTQHSAGFAGGNRDGERIYTCVCDECGQTFEAVATNLEDTYNQVETQRDTDDGYNVIDNRGFASGVGQWKIVDTYNYTATYTLANVDNEKVSVYVADNGSIYEGEHSFRLAYIFKFPYDATIVFDGPFTYVGPELGYADETDAFYRFSKNGYVNTQGTGSLIENKRSFNASANIDWYYLSKKITAEKGSSGYIHFTVPDIYIQLDDPATKYQTIPVYGGGNLSFTLDGSTTYKHTEFINTETNTFYNPVTDTTEILQSWNYDFDDRTYTGYTENGEVKIHYGDEHITVTEGVILIITTIQALLTPTMVMAVMALVQMVIILVATQTFGRN